MTQYKYRYPNESFSGCDMVASITYSYNYLVKEKSARGGDVQETVKPIYEKRQGVHILGSLQTVSYSIHMDKKPVRSIGNVNAKDYTMGQRTIAGSLVFAVFNKHFSKEIMSEHNSMFKNGEAFLVDELPPFNIVISLANEYGLRSRLIIHGVRLLNEGQVMSVNDVFTENTYQFMATDVEYLNSELKYLSSRKGVFHVLEDSKSYKDPNMRPNFEIGRAMVEYPNWDDENIEKIKLSALVKDATRNNPNGKVTLSLYPIQSEGYLEITNSSNNTQRIAVNGSSSYSIQLSPDMYSCKFSKPNPAKWKCNVKSFSIKPFKDKYNKEKYAPLIEFVTDTSIQIYSNESSHTHVKIAYANQSEYKYYSLKNRRVLISNLDRNTKYKIATCSGVNTISSPEIIVKTFLVFEKPFNDFVKMVECNAGILMYKDLTKYLEIIEKAKNISINSSAYQSPTASIATLKKGYEEQLKKLDKNNVDYSNLYAELTHNIHVCNELIYLSNKITNNITASLNKESPVTTPKIFYDEMYNNCFQFSDDITRAEFFRQYKNFAQSSSTVPSYNFKTIDNKNNSFRFVGKSGLNHYVQAIREHARSPKLEFYEMTSKEKALKIESGANKNIISNQIQSKIEYIVKEEINNNIDVKTLNRAFMRKAKFINEQIILDPHIIEKHSDYIKVKTSLNEVVHPESNSTYYIAVANKNDITQDDFIYKGKFNGHEEEILLEKIDYGILDGEDYSVWIENENFTQISNITTFSMDLEESNVDSIIAEYEISNILNELKMAVKNNISESLYNSFCDYLEFDDDINKNNIIAKSIEYFLYKGLSNSTIKSALSSMKKYIGLIMNTDDLISEINYKNFIIDFNAKKGDSITILKFNRGEYSSETLKCNIGKNLINTDNSNDEFLIIFVTTKDLRYKSQLIFINKSNGNMEVL